MSPVVSLTRKAGRLGLPVLSVLSGLLLAAALPARAGAQVRVGQVAPGFTLADENGVRHALGRHRGTIVVLEWTNPGCPFVQRHYREGTMARTAKAFAGRVVWLTVDSTHFATGEDTRRWRARHGFGYPTLQDRDGAVGRRYGARTTPQIFVIDARGVLRYQGAIDDDPHDERQRPRNHARAAIEALLAGRSPDPAETRPYGCSVKYRR